MTMAGDDGRPYYPPMVPGSPRLRTKHIVDIVLITIIGTFIMITAILCLRSTGETMDESWRSLRAHPGQLVRIIVETNDDPVTIYIVEAGTLDDWDWNPDEIPENIGVYDIPANSTETIELRLPDSDEDANWGFMFYTDISSDVHINYRQTRPIVMDHIFDTYFLPATLIVVLVICLGVNFISHRVSTRYKMR